MKWEKVKLGSVVNNHDSRRKPLNDQERSKITVHGLYPYIGANNIMGYVDEYLFDETILCVAEDGGSWGSNQRCAVIYSGKTWVNNHAHVLTPTSKLDIRYLMYFLNHADLTKYISGSTRGKLTKGSLESIEISLPPLHIQEQIADTLDKADALRRKDQELQQKYDELAQAIFYDMFGDPVRNEKGWEIVKLSNCVVGKAGIKAGPFGSSLKKEFYTKTGYKIYGQEQVISDDLNSGDYYISEEKYKELESCKVEAGDVLISMVGTFGKISVVPEGFQPGIINPRLVKLTLNRSILLPEFFKFVFKLPETKKSLSMVTRGGTMDIINAGILKEFSTILPPILLQQNFLCKLNKLTKSISKISLQQTNAFYNRIMNQTFS